MDAPFWIDMWEKAQTGFHLTNVHPMLGSHWPALGGDPGDKVLVPLCGKSLDLIYLMSQGYSVTGVELSPIAIRQFLAEHDLKANQTDIGGMPIYEVHGLRLIEGDFYQLSQKTIGHVDAIYDRAALIAMPPATQQQYASQLMALTQATAPILLITFDYDPSEMNGPPFATPPDQVYRLFEDRYHVERLEKLDALSDNPGLQNRGLTRLSETAWLLKPR